MARDLVLLDGSTFVISSATGDIDAGEDAAAGFFHQDVRHLSRFVVRLDGEPLAAVTSGGVEYYSARVIGVPRSHVGRRHRPVSVTRNRVVANGLSEHLVVENHGMEARPVHLEIAYGSDFADITDLHRTPSPIRGKARARSTTQSVTLLYERDGYRRGTRLDFSQPGRVTARKAVFEPTLDPGGKLDVCVSVTVVVDRDEREPLLPCGAFRRPLPGMPISFEDWMESCPVLDADSETLERVYRQSLADLAALRVRPTSDLEWALPAAGLPAFMTLFGRDSLIASFQALPFRPELAQTTLQALADLQASERDDFADAEPGKILHELRRGERAFFGERPSRYYGTVDSTLLFLILLDEYERWTGDANHVAQLETPARRALAWMDEHGDADRDGYLEYERRSPEGLENHCWKDSYDSIRFADGRFAHGPIAVCEAQGYAYDARRRAARLAREIWDDAGLADRLEEQAEELKRRFNRDFWIEERGHYALALDGRKQQVDSMTSNVGHLLWSGIVDGDRASAVVDRLLAEDVWTGWGVRTMSDKDAAYGPFEYHNGTVWPHDTAICAEGMRRYGFRSEAARVANALVEAAAAFAFRLPEAFAGLPRDETDTPVAYPGANRPQAFASGAPLMALRTLTGLDADDRRIAHDVAMTDGLGSLTLRGLVVRGTRHDITIAPGSLVRSPGHRLAGNDR